MLFLLDRFCVLFSAQNVFMFSFILLKCTAVLKIIIYSYITYFYVIWENAQCKP